MKDLKLTNKTATFILILVGMISCIENPDDLDLLNPHSVVGSSAALSITTSDNLWIDPNVSETSFNLTGSNLEEVSSIIVQVLLITQDETGNNLVGLPSDLESIDNPTLLKDTITLEYSGSDFLSALDISASDVVAGNTFQVVFKIIINGQKYTDRATHTVLLSCPTNIPLGTWTLKGGGGTTELSYDGAGVYSLSELQFGYYNPAYGDIPGKFLDVCDNLTLLGSTDGTAYGIAWKGSGSYKSEEGIITFNYYDATYCDESCLASVTLIAP